MSTVAVRRGTVAWPRRASWSQRRDRRGLWFVAPFTVMFVLFLVTPLGYAVYESLYTTRLVGGRVFVGLDNYREAIHDSTFWSGVWHVALFGAVQIPLMLLIAFFFATIFDLGVARFGPFFRALFFLPFAVPAVVASVMWNFLLEPSFGPFAHLAAFLGFPDTNFFSPGLIWPTIVVIVIWEWTGYNMIILYTALRSVPNEVVEAAVLDGATLRKVITRVKLPMVRPAIVMLAFLNVIGALQLFVEPQILGEFYPQAISNHFTPTIYIYQRGIAGQEYGIASATAVLLAIVIVGISTGVLLLSRRRRRR
jgi:multiple sugar transport system permease protein